MLNQFYRFSPLIEEHLSCCLVCSLHTKQQGNKIEHLRCQAKRPRAIRNGALEEYLCMMMFPIPTQKPRPATNTTYEKNHVGQSLDLVRSAD